MVIAVASNLILMGTGADYVRVVVGVLSVTGLGVVFGFLVGGLADNQISGIAVLKVLILVFTGIPLASLFVPEAYQWVFYPFPNYWGFQILRNVFTGEGALGFWGSCLVTLLFNAAVMVVLTPALRRRLKFR